MSTIRPIRDENSYQGALKRLSEIFHAKKGSPESDEADVLAVLLEDYENNNFPIEAPDPIEAIKIRMEDLGLQQKDLIPLLGQKSRVSEILNRKRKLNLEMIRKLSQKLNIPIVTLAQDYSLNKEHIPG